MTQISGLTNQWQIGDVRISRIVEMEITGGSRFILPDATREACLAYPWMQPNFMDDQGNLIMSIHALVVDTGERRILVDTCIGNDKQRAIPNWNMLQTAFLDDLSAAGYPRESIDTVMCTHLHVDHVGWNTMLVDGEWVPTFTNSRYLISAEEWSYWDAAEDDDTYGPIMADSVRPVVQAGLVDFVDMDHRVCDEGLAGAHARAHPRARQRSHRLERRPCADHRRLHPSSLPDDPDRLVQFGGISTSSRGARPGKRCWPGTSMKTSW